MPKVSVIIPAYNAERFLGDTLRSVLEQTYQDFEIIVVDDGSTDGTQAVVTAVVDERVHYIHQENRGPAAARNAGLRLARGEYIAFLDADDLWRPERLEACVSFLDEHTQVDVVHTAFDFINPDGRPFPAKSKWGDKSTTALEHLVFRNDIHTSTALVRRRCFDVAGLFDESLRGSEDWYLWFRIAAAGFQFDFIPLSLAVYRRHENNKTLNHELEHTTRLTVLDKIFSQPDLVSQIAHLKNKAYARVLARLCIEAFESNLVQSALRDFSVAAEYDAGVMTSLSLYYQVACISVPIGDTPTSQNINIELGQQYLNTLIKHIDSMEVAGITLRDKQKARATAYLALGMVDYSHRSDMASARSHFSSSIRYFPTNRTAWTWLARAIVGKDRLQHLRSILGRLKGHVVFPVQT